jgi:hypothetical protein
MSVFDASHDPTQVVSYNGRHFTFAFPCVDAPLADVLPKIDSSDAQYVCSAMPGHRKGFQSNTESTLRIDYLVLRPHCTCT